LESSDNSGQPGFPIGKVTLPQKVGVLVLSLKDTWLISMVSTLHTAESADALRKRAGTTKCIIEYNTYTHGVDCADHCLSYYTAI
jgi:hypothetical protein